MLVCLALLAACAVVEPPPGGPRDMTPPHLVAASPDSGARDLGPDVRKLSFTFSEKMDRRSATGWLFFFPDQRVRKTSWKGAITAEIELEEPLPPDTVVVVEVAATMADAHKVPARRARTFPIATGGAIPGGSIAGVLVMGDSAVTTGVVELFPVPPDTLEYFQQRIVRRTRTGQDGAYVFPWLPAPGGPWLARAYVDADGDLRPGANEPVRLLPDTLALTAAAPQLAAGVTTLYPVDTPGRLHVPPVRYFGPAAPLMAWSLSTGEVDTGFTPQPVDPRRNPYGFVRADSASVLREVRPGLNTVGLFVDVDADSAFGAVPDSLLRPLLAGFAWQLADSSADTSGWYLEPLVVATSPRLEPGLDADLALPDTLPVVVPWPAPPPAPAAPDTAAPAAADTAAFPPPAPEEP